MSVDRTLRIQSSLARHRNVLSRAERVAKLEAQELWTEDATVLSMPKVANRKVKAGKKKSKKEEAATEEAAKSND